MDIASTTARFSPAAAGARMGRSTGMISAAGVTVPLLLGVLLALAVGGDGHDGAVAVFPGQKGARKIRTRRTVG